MDTEILETIYDEVEEVAPGLFALKLNKKLGLASKNTGLFIDTEYESALVRENYAAFFKSDNNSTSNRLIMLNTELIKEFKLKKTTSRLSTNDILKEHSSLNYRIVEAMLLDDEEGVISAIDSLTGVLLFKRKADKDYSYRPYNNEVIIGYLDANTEQYMALTKDMQVMTVENALNTIYDKVERMKGKAIKYKCIKNGEEYILNKFGQLY